MTAIEEGDDRAGHERCRQALRQFAGRHGLGCEGEPSVQERRADQETEESHQFERDCSVHRFGGAEREPPIRIHYR